MSTKHETTNNSKQEIPKRKPNHFYIFNKEEKKITGNKIFKSKRVIRRMEASYT